MTRERDQYGRASIAERIGGLWEGFRANRAAPGGGAVPGVGAARRAEGAELAACDMSHSHEVSAVFTVDDPTGAPYPGDAALLERELGRCLEVFGPFVGRALADSIYHTFLVAPGEDGWLGGDRHGVCLIVLGNGRFMDGQARGGGTALRPAQGMGPGG